MPTPSAYERKNRLGVRKVMMTVVSDVELVWKNKDRRLFADGGTGYQWLDEAEAAALPAPDVQLLDHSRTPSVDDNILVVGDALDALSALEQQGAVSSGSIRLLYIDPPFNTQKTFTQYGDRLATPMWLSMLRDRLVAARPLMSADSSIWLHLDDSEVHRARLVLDEVFGADAFVASVIWQKRTTRESRSAFSTNHDTILVYAPAGPRRWKTSRNLLLKDANALTNRDNDPRGPWADAPFTAPGFRKAQQYDIVTPTGKVLRPPRGRSWYATRPTFDGLMAEGRIWFPKAGNGSPRMKLFAHQLRGLVPFTVWGAPDVGTNDDAKRHLMQLFPENEVFDTPKPEELLERIIHIATNPGELVLDLFAGSGTTAAVAHKMGRQWIAVERNPSTAIDVCARRLDRVVGAEDPGGVTEMVGWSGGGAFSRVAAPPRTPRKTTAQRTRRRAPTT